ncbi:MAG: hypothetical protein DRQ89_13600 [Epsilonproteobacteria bacterium]|nr:MAG: hypothetical protein DRQ89_13600 [Campylobacterota bacterium]
MSTEVGMKPHRACDLVISKVEFPVMTMPKLDGVRGVHMNGKFQSRTLKPFRNKRLDLFNDSLLKGMDGELLAGDIDSQSCMRTTSFTSSFCDKTDDIALPIWNVFDYITEKTQHLKYITRYNMLVDAVNSGIEKRPSLFNFIKIVNMVIANNEDELYEIHSNNIEEGHEGTIVRSFDGRHKNGRCTANEGRYLRMKDLGDEECIILSVIEAQTNNNPQTTNELGNSVRSSHKEYKEGNGMVGSIEVQIPDGRIIRIGAGHMTHEERIKYFENPPIGKRCTYKFMPHGEKDMRRHPRFKCFREDDK